MRGGVRANVGRRREPATRLTLPAICTPNVARTASSGGGRTFPRSPANPALLETFPSMPPFACGCARLIGRARAALLELDHRRSDTSAGTWTVPLCRVLHRACRRTDPRSGIALGGPSCETTPGGRWSLGGAVNACVGLRELNPG